MFFTKTSSSKNFFRNRAAMIKGFFMGAYSFGDMVSLVLPAKISPSRAKLLPKYESFIKEKSKEEISSFMEKNYPGVLEKIEGNDRLSLVYEIMAMDQYDAKTFLKPDSIVIDAGANIGVFSILAAKLAQNGKIFAFEPVKNTYDILKKNVGQIPQVVVLNQGLGDKEKSQEILTASRNVGMNAMADSELALKNKRYFDGSEKTYITTIDNAVEKQKIQRVDFIKIDTEGYESQIIEGARQTIRKWKPTIAMSAYHRKNDKYELPRLVKEICPDYVCKFHKDAEADLVCYIEEK